MNENYVHKNLIKEDLLVSHRKNFDKLKAGSHYHNVCEIFFLINGQGNFFIKDNTYPMKANSLFLINNFDIHRTIIPGQDFFYERFVLYFKKEFINKYIKSPETNFKPQNIFSRDNRQLLLNDNQSQKFVQLTEKMILEQTQKKTGYQTIIQSYLLQIFVLILRIIDQSSQDREDDYEGDDNRLHQIVSFLNNNFTRTITLKEIADQFYISKYYLSHFFKEKTGFTVIEYINNKRVSEAQKLLENSQLSVTDISYQVGFNSLTHFERTFKTLTGLTPSQFRKIS